MVDDVYELPTIKELDREARSLPIVSALEAERGEGVLRYHYQWETKDGLPAGSVDIKLTPPHWDKSIPPRLFSKGDITVEKFEGATGGYKDAYANLLDKIAANRRAITSAETAAYAAEEKRQLAFAAEMEKRKGAAPKSASLDPREGVKNVGMVLYGDPKNLDTPVKFQGVNERGFMVDVPVKVTSVGFPPDYYSSLSLSAVKKLGANVPFSLPDGVRLNTDNAFRYVVGSFALIEGDFPAPKLKEALEPHSAVAGSVSSPSASQSTAEKPKEYAFRLFNGNNIIEGTKETSGSAVLYDENARAPVQHEGKVVMMKIGADGSSSLMAGDKKISLSDLQPKLPAGSLDAEIRQQNGRNVTEGFEDALIGAKDSSLRIKYDTHSALLTEMSKADPTFKKAEGKAQPAATATSVAVTPTAAPTPTTPTTTQPMPSATTTPPAAPTTTTPAPAGGDVLTAELADRLQKSVDAMIDKVDAKSHNLAAFKTLDRLKETIKPGARITDVARALNQSQSFMEVVWKNNKDGYSAGYTKPDGGVFSDKTRPAEPHQRKLAGGKEFNGERPKWQGNKDVNPANAAKEPTGGLWMDLQKQVREPLEKAAGKKLGAAAVEEAEGRLATTTHDFTPLKDVVAQIIQKTGLPKVAGKITGGANSAPPLGPEHSPTIPGSVDISRMG